MRLDELRDVQIKVLTEADIYRISGGEEEQQSSRTPSGSGPGGPTPQEAVARAKSGGGSTPNIPNTPNI